MIHSCTPNVVEGDLGGVPLFGQAGFTAIINLGPYLLKKVPNQRMLYHLRAIVVYISSDIMARGHYVAYICEGGVWWCFDDIYVTQVTSTLVYGKTAQLMFYQSGLPNSPQPAQPPAVQVGTT